MTTGDTILCFDFGLARIGVAIGYTETHSAHPLATIETDPKNPDYAAVDRLVEQWSPQQLIVGAPSEDSPRSLLDAINAFIEHLAKFSIPVSQMDEAYSSMEAKKVLKAQRQDKLRGKIKKEDIDKMAACLILESWFLSAHGTRAE